MTKLTDTQEMVLKYLIRFPGEWKSAGNISDSIRKIAGFEHIRAGAIGGPARSLFNRGLIEREVRERKVPMRMRNGRVVFPKYHVYMATAQAFVLLSEPSQGELNL